jgi:hypothetical protein
MDLNLGSDISAITGLVTKVLDVLGLDPTVAADAKLKLMTLEQNGDLAKITAMAQEDVAQAATNTASAGSASTFVAGARPFILWVCGAALAEQFLLGPLLTWSTALFGHPVAFPELGGPLLDTLLTGMLGLGTMRTVEHLGGVATQGVSTNPLANIISKIPGVGKK